MACRTAVRQRPAGHTFLCKILIFSNGCILLTIGSVYTKLLHHHHHHHHHLFAFIFTRKFLKEK